MDNYQAQSSLHEKLGVVNRRIGFYRLIETLYFALLVEEAVLVALRDEKVELKITPGELHTSGDGCPFAEGDGLVLGGAVGEGVATDDVLLEHVAEGEEVGTFFHHTARCGLTHHTALRLYGVICTACVQPLRGWVLGENIVFQSGAAGLGVVGEDVDTVAGADGDEALELPFGLGFEVLQKGEFAAEDFDEEVAVAAGGLEEAAVEPERLVAHQVEHGVHLARIGEHLAMVSHPLAAFDLFCVFVAGHKKSWNFAYAILGVPRPAQQLSKAHDYS